MLIEVVHLIQLQVTQAKFFCNIFPWVSEFYLKNTVFIVLVLNINKDLNQTTMLLS